MRLFCVAAFLLTIACTTRKPPFSPQDEIKTFRLPPGFRAELVAAEPQIADAVTIAFDPQGRIYAAEMPEYPLDPKPLGRIKLLEDRDNDGRYEHATVFADGVHFPEGVLPWRKGVLVACAPDLLYLEDTNGDGRADVRKVLMTGFATGNPQLRLNNPIYGLDNWIYAAHPRPPVPRRYVKEFGNTTTAIRFPDRPDIAPLEVRGMDIRFHPDSFEVERVSGNSQFAHAFDTWGNRFTVWNNDHVRHVVIQNQYLTKNPYLSTPSVMQSVSDHEPQAAVFPVTQDPLVIHDTQAGRFTSACGLSVYTGGNLPQDFENNSFTCEPVHNLVHRDILKPAGATFSASRAYEHAEFMSATDAWFRPVYTTTGPDGALYVVDFYHYTVEHPEFVPPQLLKQIDFNARQRFGRIWRVVHESSKAGRKPDLQNAGADSLVGELSNPNMWWRINAQRLLVERQDKSVVPALEKLARESASPYARLHALWALEGLHALNPDLVISAMMHPQAELRLNGVLLAESRLQDAKVKSKVFELAADRDPRVEFQVACTLTRVPPHESTRLLQGIATRHADDRWFQAAVLASAADTAGAWFRFATGLKGPRRNEFIRRVTSIAGAKKQDAEIASILRDAARQDDSVRTAALEGLADGLRQGSSGQLKLPKTQPVLLGMLEARSPEVSKAALRGASSIDLAPSPQLNAMVAKASTVVSNGAGPTERRCWAAGVLGLVPAKKSVPVLARLLTPAEPQELQEAAAAALANLPSEEVTPVLLERWRAATGKTRNVLLNTFFSDQKRLPALLNGIQAGKVQPWALGPARTRQLLQHSDPEIKRQAQALLSEPESDRKAVYEKYLPAITSTSDADRGRKVYEANCVECHKVGDVGQELGPDLRSVAKRYKETLLADILMPNQNIEGGYEEYLLQTTDGREITGILAKETSTTLTLRRRKGDEDIILRSNVKSLRSLSLSPMPEDLEKNITIDQMADLIAFLKSLK
jgi:putative membrane-bound dehydrogenase-like protein